MKVNPYVDPVAFENEKLSLRLYLHIQSIKDWEFRKSLAI
jgi:hypothetical protein